MKKIAVFKYAITAYRAMSNKHGLTDKLYAFYKFIASYFKYLGKDGNVSIKISTEDLYPRLFDDIPGTPVDPVYFYQDTWCAGKIFAAHPDKHFDIGSSAEFIGIISQFTPTTMVDIRPLPVELPGLSFVKGSILDLPFPDNSISSLSSLCVIEHIGLGRYGDPLDQFGSEKAAKELSRVLMKGGILYVSVPVDSETKTYFNAHRAFTRNYVIGMFPGLDLSEEKYVYGNSTFEKYEKSNGFGTGLYLFKKNR